MMYKALRIDPILFFWWTQFGNATEDISFMFFPGYSVSGVIVDEERASKCVRNANEESWIFRERVSASLLVSDLLLSE